MHISHFHFILLNAFIHPFDLVHKLGLNFILIENFDLKLIFVGLYLLFIVVNLLVFVF